MIKYHFHDVTRPAFFAKITPWLANSATRLFAEIDSLVYVFCSDQYLLELNQAQLQHDYYTDIITFDLRDTVLSPLACEIYISLDRVTENAGTFNSTFEHELKRVMVHGLLHLCGLKDDTIENKNAMRDAEDLYLKSS
jgi:probable rRNA maturation factor